MRRAVSDRQCRCIFVSYSVRHSDQLVLGNQALLGESAVHHFSHQAPLPVQRINEHAVADLPTIDARTLFQNVTRHVESNDHGQRHLDAGHSAHGEDVVVIEGGRPDANHDMVWFHHRVGKVGHILQVFEAALLFEHYGFHRLDVCYTIHASFNRYPQ